MQLQVHDELGPFHADPETDTCYEDAHIKDSHKIRFDGKRQ
jgi:hypothetical protein